MSLDYTRGCVNFRDVGEFANLIAGHIVFPQGRVLRIFGLPDAVIIEEYLLSQGDVQTIWIQQALAGIGDPQVYFKTIDLTLVRQNIRGL